MPHLTIGSASSAPASTALDTVDAIRAMRDGRAKVFMAMGGNFASATPDTAVTEAALRSCSLTVQVSTKLNRSHLVHGTTALILPSLGRTDKDVQAGAKQMVSVEDSMSMVHLSRGSLKPPSDEVRSEVAIVCQLAGALLGPDHPVPWETFNDDYDLIRDAIAAVVPGCADYNTKVRQPDGFQLPHPPRDSREFPTSTGKANFALDPLEWVPVPQGRLVLQTLRSHDQYNTTIYGLDDRYRGVKGGRRVVFVNPADIEAFGLSDGDRVDLVSEFTDGDGQLQERTRQGLHGGGLLDTGRQRRRLLPGDQSACAAGPHRRQVEYAGVEGDRHPIGESHGPGDRAPTGQPRHRRRCGDAARRRWSSRSRWRSASTANRSPSRCAHRARMSNWRKASCSPRASSGIATTCSPCATARAPDPTT